MPVVQDRCLQALVKNALEPAWEAKFEGSSYGFRPGRDCHDAIEKIFILACPNKTKKWVLDADIKGAFDNISHTNLLEAIGPVPGRELIKQWLEAGYLEQEMFYATERGVPQGGLCKALHKPPYAKWKAMQRKCKESLKLLHCCPIYLA